MQTLRLHILPYVGAALVTLAALHVAAPLGGSMSAIYGSLTAYAVCIVGALLMRRRLGRESPDACVLMVASCVPLVMAAIEIPEALGLGFWPKLALAMGIVLLSQLGLDRLLYSRDERVRIRAALSGRPATPGPREPS